MNGRDVVGMAWMFSLAAMWLLVGCSQAGPQKGAPPMTISAGKVVSIEYTLKLENQEVIDSTQGKDPLTYTHGTEQLVPGLERAMEGMAVGDSKQVTVTPEDGYGSVNPSAFQEVKKDLIPPDAKVGAQLQGKGPDGQPVYPRVSEIKDDSVVLDFNHPLAGKTLNFDVKIVDIKSPPVQ